MITNFELDFNSNIQGNWEGGDLTSDGGAWLIKNFLYQVGLPSLLAEHFFIPEDDAVRFYENDLMLMQSIFFTILGYHNQKDSDELKKDPILNDCFEKGLASQSTYSRFINRLNEGSFDQLIKVNQIIIENFYKQYPPESKTITCDIDTSYFETFGRQEGASYNKHYDCTGLSPLAIFDYEAKLLIGADLREGTTYCSNGADELITSVLERFQESFPELTCRFRGDSGFASPKVYDACEEKGAEYVIRLKDNQVLEREANKLINKEYDPARCGEDQTIVGEFMYKAGTWKRARRVICEIKLIAGELLPRNMYIVTNVSDMTPKEVLAFYRKRGNMENYIKEAKNGFAIDKVSQQSLVVNKNQFMMKMIAYNLKCIFSALVLPEAMQSYQIETLRNKLFKVAARRVKHARKIVVKLCSHFPLKREFEAILQNIRLLKLNFST